MNNEKAKKMQDKSLLSIVVRTVFNSVIVADRKSVV